MIMKFPRRFAGSGFNRIIILSLITSFIVVGFIVYLFITKLSSSDKSYKYTLAEFLQKQQTTSPYTKYEPAIALDTVREKIYYIYKEMDENGVWQIWTATTDFNGDGWEEVKQTTSSEDKQRPGILYNPENDTIYYFYRIGSDINASTKVISGVMMASKEPDEKYWSTHKQIFASETVDDTMPVALDIQRQKLIFAYTKDFQIATAFLDLASGNIKETVHTREKVNSYIPHMEYDSQNDTVYIVFPRARTPGFNNDKDIWLAKVKGDGSDYKEVRLTLTDYENTWPFITLDIPRNRLYVRYSTFREPPIYRGGVANIRERKTLGMADLDGGSWKILQDRDGMSIFGVDSRNGYIYGIYTEPYKEFAQGEERDRFFVIYDPVKAKLKKQLIPSPDKLTDFDAINLRFDNKTRRLFGAQQVCHPAEEKDMECQIWTYTGKVLDGGKSSLPVQTKTEFVTGHESKLPDFKILKISATSSKITINTNRKLSLPAEMKVVSNGSEVELTEKSLHFVDQDRGFQWDLPQSLSNYVATYEICAFKPNCLKGEIIYP